MKIEGELAHRHQDGLEVTLLWDASSGAVWIELVDDRAGESRAFPVDAAAALDAFYHPYAYAPEPVAGPGEAVAAGGLHPASERSER